ncbi:MAG: hypothetical protein KDK39_02290 [Leptospiraceae bacterium]|nr:hypothetical protein [Leptospiraceae bacterium]
MTQASPTRHTYRASNQEQLNRIIDRSLQKHTTITLRTWYLSKDGQKSLNRILERILSHFNRMDLHDVLYTASKEIVMNATKANLKRLLFGQLADSDPDPAEYNRLMTHFKENLNEERIREMKHQFIAKGYFVDATIYYNPEVINIKVKNKFPLYRQEELRIREKFHQAEEFSNLIDFYMKHGDDTEGAGLGLTMVGILLEESGIDRHCFTIFSNQYEETAAKLEIPLVDSYVPKRRRFEKEFEESYLTLEAFRDEFRQTLKQQP